MDVFSRRELLQRLLAAFSLPAAVAAQAGLPRASRIAAGLGLGSMAAHPAALEASVYDIVRRYYPPRSMIRVKGKHPLIKITSRPYNLETPLSSLTTPLTPNDAFFVRARLALTPDDVAVEGYRLRVQGMVERPVELTLHDLKTQFEPVTVTAVLQCSGNSMAFFDPPILPGWNLTHGFMGCATWTGARVRDVLAAAGLKAGARDLVFKGLDRPIIDRTPLVEKSFRVDLDRGIDENLLVGYAMNGRPLPVLNGYPVRLIAPGWYGTYWVKWLESITVVSKEFSGFWMKHAYRVPTHPVKPYEQPRETVPVSRYNVKSVITSPEDGARFRVGQPVPLTGVAFDGGDGIQTVSISLDGGTSWQDANIPPTDGRFAWRRWTFTLTPKRAGKLSVMSKATNLRGETQPLNAVWNPGGYEYNAVDSIDLYITT